MTDQPTPAGQSLPERPSMEYMRKCAKEQLRELRNTQPDAKLATAQKALAREHGFSSWRKLKAHVEEVTFGRLKPVFDAIDQGDLEALRPLIQADPELLHGLFMPHESTLLHRAVRQRQFPIARFLLDQGADPNRRDRGDHATPMHFAAEQGDLEAVTLLAEAGGDIHGGGDTHGLGLLGWATCFARCNRNVADFLLARGAKHHVFTAIAMGDARALQEVLDQDPSSLTRTMSKWESHQTPLHFAVTKKKPELLKLLLNAGADVNRTDLHDRTALQLAALKKDGPALEVFANIGLSPEDLESEEGTAFTGTTPILNVKNVPDSIAYYVEKLGFSKDWEWGSPPDFASVNRNEQRVFLCQNGQGQPGTWISFWVEDVDALYAEYQDRGAMIVQPPTNFPWGVREMNVTDPDGHRFRMAMGATDESDDVPLAE